MISPGANREYQMTRIRYKEVAGLPVTRGRPSTRLLPKKETLVRLYTREEKSIREVAEILDCTKDMVYRALKEYGIERRLHTWKPKLSKYDLEFIKETVEKKGYRKGAQELGVDKSTLFRYLRRMEKLD